MAAPCNSQEERATSSHHRLQTLRQCLPTQALAQHYCSKQCRQNSFHQRKRSVEWGLPATTIPEKRRTDLERAPTTLTVCSDAPARVFANGPTPGALQGDDYPLEYDEKGYPELPDCLRR